MKAAVTLWVLQAQEARRPHARYHLTPHPARVETDSRHSFRGHGPRPRGRGCANDARAVLLGVHGSSAARVRPSESRMAAPGFRRHGGDPQVSAKTPRLPALWGGPR